LHSKALHNVLITRPIDEAPRKLAEEIGLHLLIREAIAIRFPDIADSVVNIVETHPDAPWIFTSQNAVKAIAKVPDSGKMLPQPPAVYAVGDKTTNALQKLGIQAKAPVAEQNAEGLVRFIVNEQASEEYIYFCGNRSLGTLQKELINEGCTVFETEVYETVLLPVELPDEPVEAMLFYSPSAVEAFAKGSGFSGKLPNLFAIGPTTAKALAEKTRQDIFISPKPDTEVFLRYVSRILKAGS
jgi:uroporphyrinogen-III synthase